MKASWQAFRDLVTNPVTTTKKRPEGRFFDLLKPLFFLGFLAPAVGWSSFSQNQPHKSAYDFLIFPR